MTFYLGAVHELTCTNIVQTTTSLPKKEDGLYFAAGEKDAANSLQKLERLKTER